VGVVTPREKAWKLFLPWAALVAGATAWFASQQVGSNLSQADCRASGALAVGLIGLLALAFTIAGGLLSHRVWRTRNEGVTRKFIAQVGVMAAALLGLAIVLQTLASLIIPSCFG
jgi:hypothetical protein